MTLKANALKREPRNSNGKTQINKQTNASFHPDQIQSSKLSFIFGCMASSRLGFIALAAFGVGQFITAQDTKKIASKTIGIGIVATQTL